jgi:hypothetical protein
MDEPNSSSNCNDTANSIHELAYIGLKLADLRLREVGDDVRLLGAPLVPSCNPLTEYTPFISIDSSTSFRLAK